MLRNRALFRCGWIQELQHYGAFIFLSLFFSLSVLLPSLLAPPSGILFPKRSKDESWLLWASVQLSTDSSRSSNLSPPRICINPSPQQNLTCFDRINLVSCVWPQTSHRVQVLKMLWLVGMEGVMTPMVEEAGLQRNCVNPTRDIPPAQQLEAGTASEFQPFRANLSTIPKCSVKSQFCTHLTARCLVMSICFPNRVLRSLRAAPFPLDLCL